VSNFKSLKKPRLSQEVERAIKDSIAEGLYKAGEKLPSERELVDSFQVSRVTIREALKNLQNSGLIAIKRGMNAGAYISEPTAEPITENFDNLIRLGKIDYSHLLDARLYFEPRAAEIAARYRTLADIARLKNLLDSAEEQMESSRREARLKNVSFHCEVAKITENPIILFITESITQSYSALIIEKTRAHINHSTISTFIAEHRNILDAIEKKDPSEAFERTRRHLFSTYLTYAQVAPDECETEIGFRIRQDFEC